MWSRTVRVIVTLSLGLLAARLTADTQPRRNIPVIGVLANADLSTALADPKSSVAGFRQGLREMGYVEGQNIDIEYRPLGGKQGLLSIFAAELVRLKVDVLVTFGLIPTRAAREATATIPIVFACTFDPVERGLVESLAQPGGNLTGTAGTTLGLIGKQFELLKEVAPVATRVAVLVDPTHPAHELRLPGFQAVTRSLGLDLHLVEVRDPPNELERAFAALAHERINAIHIAAGPTFPPYRAQIVALVAKSQRPALYPSRADVRAGGLMSYDADCPALAQRAGNLVGKILQGAKPAELPVELPLKYHLAINLKTAKALGITIPPHLLILADEVIQ
jgi:putative tryptophan/tyrosine transport system substrate-binding protein